VLTDRSPSDLLDEAMHSSEGQRDPYPLLQCLVDEQEYYISAEGNSYVFSYGLSQATLRSPDLYKGGEHVSSASMSFTRDQREVLSREEPDSSGMLTSIDDPDHARLRRLVSLFFTPKAIDKLRVYTEEVLDRMLADLPHDEPVDLLATLFTELPSEVVGSLIGLPLSDRAPFAALAAVSSVGRDPEASFDDRLKAARARRDMQDIIEAMIAEERRDPADTLVGGLIRLGTEGERISDAEVVSLTALLHSAGFGTTKRALGNGLVALLRHPEQAKRVRADESITRQATDEVLRYDPSVTTVAYWVGEGAHLRDAPLEPGSLCTVVIGAANRDRRVFEDPEAFDITIARSSAPLAFGYGAHYCLGAALARMEMDVVLGSLVRRFPRMELAEDPERTASFRSRTFKNVEVVLEPGGSP
jgi:cytochrome P450